MLILTLVLFELILMSEYLCNKVIIYE